jgi:hypothetical protein
MFFEFISGNNLKYTLQNGCFMENILYIIGLIPIMVENSNKICAKNLKDMR